MSTTVNSIISNINTFIGDTSTDRVSDTERLEAVTEATAWLLEELGNEHMVETYDLDYLDTINYYKVTGAIPDLLTGADLRREKDNVYSFARKSPREMSEEIAQKATEPSWAIERRDSDIYLAVNATPKNAAMGISYFESLTDGGSWVVDSSTSDASNLTVDTNEFTQGSASLNFDVTVGQSVNNRATIYTPLATNSNLSSFEDIGTFLLDVYLPDVTYITSVTLTWGSTASATPATKAAYWSYTATTGIGATPFKQGWNTIKIDWKDATKTGSPLSNSCVYQEITINYSASQPNDTDFRVDNFRVAIRERLNFHYISWHVGFVSSVDNTPITAFTATTNVPFFSGLYDNYKYTIAHKAASILFSSLRLREDAAIEDKNATESLTRYKNNFESSKVREVKSFKLPHSLRRRSKTGRLR